MPRLDVLLRWSTQATKTAFRSILHTPKKRGSLTANGLGRYNTSVSASSHFDTLFHSVPNTSNSTNPPRIGAARHVPSPLLPVGLTPVGEASSHASHRLSPKRRGSRTRTAKAQAVPAVESFSQRSERRRAERKRKSFPPFPTVHGRIGLFSGRIGLDTDALEGRWKDFGRKSWCGRRAGEE